MRIEHIAVYLNDLEAGKDFFVKYFDARPNEGYHNRQTGFRSYFLSFEGGARLEIMSRPDMTEGKRTQPGAGYDHIAFSAGGREAVDSLTARLAADGYEIVSGPRTTGDGYYESCVTGIEGILIEITA